MSCGRLKLQSLFNTLLFESSTEMLLLCFLRLGDSLAALGGFGQRRPDLDSSSETTVHCRSLRSFPEARNGC